MILMVNLEHVSNGQGQLLHPITQVTGRTCAPSERNGIFFPCTMVHMGICHQIHCILCRRCVKKKSNFDAGNPYPELKEEINEKINPQSRCTLSLNSSLELECGSISATTINNFPNYSPSGH